ncbi:hypothetical protein FLX56_27255 [Synechococcus moorigangaii CMS01]|nr:hypothetical protein [Synechococcus moorigangaii CMS01]
MLTILGVSDEFDYNSIAAFGGSFERLPVQLQAVSADGEGGFSFNKGANPFPLPTLSAHRCRMIAAFAMPRWLSSRPDRKDYYRYAPNDWDVYGNLVKWLTREAVANGVTHIEVWNEASVIGHWGDTMDNLIRLHQSSYEAIKSIAPQITVLGGCTHTWHFRFLRDFFENDGGSWCDGISVHGYTYQPHRRKEYFDELEALMEEFKPRNDWPSFKAHITEIGFRVPAYSEREQARQLLLFTLEAATRSRIGSVLWFRFMNKMKEDLSAYKQRASTGYAMIGNSEMYCREALLAYRLADIVLQSDLAPSEISRLLDGSFGAGVAPLSSPEVWSTLQNMLNLSDN